MYIAILKNVVGENGEWQLSNGECTTERNCGFHLWYANFQSLRCLWSEMDTPTVDVPLRVLDPSNKRNSHFFQLKSIPRFGNVLELKQFILQHYQDETKAKDTSFELGYFAGNRRFNIRPVTSILYGGVLTRPNWTKLPKCIFYLILFNWRLVNF